MLDLFRDTPVTGLVIVTTHAEEVMFVPSVEVAVMFVVPVATGVTRPDELTVATAVLLDAHVTTLLVALEGVTVSVKSSVDPN